MTNLIVITMIKCLDYKFNTYRITEVKIRFLKRDGGGGIGS